MSAAPNCGSGTPQANVVLRLVGEICVRGHLGETIRSAFPALQAQAHGGNTVLTGILPDQAALYGLLAEVEALGLELIELRRLPPQEPQDPSS